MPLKSVRTFPLGLCGCSQTCTSGMVSQTVGADWSCFLLLKRDSSTSVPAIMCTYSATGTEISALGWFLRADLNVHCIASTSQGVIYEVSVSPCVLELFLMHCVHVHPIHMISYPSCIPTDGKEEARKQNEKRPAEWWILRASRETEALLQNSERI